MRTSQFLIMSIDMAAPQTRTSHLLFMSIKKCCPKKRTSHLLIKSNLKGRDNQNISYSHHVTSSQLKLEAPQMRTSHPLIRSIKNNSPHTRTSHLLIKSNLEGRDNENFSHSHQVDQSFKPPKQELLIFSSCLSKMAAPQTRTSHLLIMSIKNDSPPNENFSASH